MKTRIMMERMITWTRGMICSAIRMMTCSVMMMNKRMPMSKSRK